MLILFSKEKIVSYFIAFSTIVFLLCLSATNIYKQETVESSSKATYYNNTNHKNVIVDSE
ncbi:MAG: hypothetical protein IKP28_01975 [Clostridia bacterium]|nr:hypothetical protein [Clostridia bacterium]